MSDYNALLQDFLNEPNPVARYQYPFPIAVYGTLRRYPECQGNSMLMEGYDRHSRCFIPNFCPHGITLTHFKAGSGLAELYEYDDLDIFEDVLAKCDRLEGFDPERGGWHYLRTLMIVHKLPSNFSEEHFEAGINDDDLIFPRKIRDLEIPVSRWKNYESFPAWVYSNAHANEDAHTIPNLGI